MQSSEKKIRKNKFLDQTLSGKALLSTIVICFVILTIISIVSMTARTRFDILAKSESRLITLLTNNSCTNLLSAMSTSDSNCSSCFDTIINQNNRINYCKLRKWGLFNVLTCKSCSNIDTINSAKLVGFKLNNSLKNTSLILTNDKDVVSIGGNSSIEGIVYLPKGRIDRKNFIETSEASRAHREELVRNSSDLDFTKYVLSNECQNDYSSIEPFNCAHKLTIFNDLEKIDLINSFHDSTNIVFSNGTIELNNARIIGNVVVYSLTNIIISSSNEINDVLFIAPSILVEKEFKGSAHFMVRDSIIIEDQCYFNYPSSISFQPERAGVLRFGKYCRFEGAISALKSNNNFRTINVDLGIENNFYGSIYSEYPLYASGQFNGLIISPSFGFISERIVNNHLQDVELKHSLHFDFFAFGLKTNEGFNTAKILE